MGDTRRIKVTEVHNFGGFFGGDTVTLSAAPWPDGDEETFTIDEKALVNIADRHTIAPGMLLELDMAGDRVDRAHLLAAREYEVLQAALGAAPPSGTLDGPRVRAYRCTDCDLWVAGQPLQANDTLACDICAQALR